MPPLQRKINLNYQLEVTPPSVPTGLCSRTAQVLQVTSLSLQATGITYFFHIIMSLLISSGHSCFQNTTTTHSTNGILFFKAQKLCSAFDFQYVDFLPLFLQCQRFCQMLPHQGLKKDFCEKKRSNMKFKRRTFSKLSWCEVHIKIITAFFTIKLKF